MAKKVKVSQDLCIACSTCWVIDPAHFAQGSDGKAKVKNGNNDTDLQIEKVVTDDTGIGDAIASCPVGAITEEEE